jgi:SAM-dependent MidA family methyltransferase
VIQPGARTPLAELLSSRIRASGLIPFAEYMRECLYHPVHGYYAKAEAQRFADFYTSVDVHPVFGQLLARQLAEMWERLERPARFRAVETGAGTGRLAGQILAFARRALPEFYEALKYIAVERSNVRREKAEAALRSHAAAGHATARAEIPAEIAVGCVLSNELVDALAVHRVVQEEGTLREIFVGWEKDGFVEVRAPLSTCALSEYFAAQGITLREGQQAEAGLEACEWIEEMGKRLRRGFVLTIDYGHKAAELYDERHLRGTLLAYQQHCASEDYFAAPGEQDLTAHVNFTALEIWGKRAGLEGLGFVSQAQFLMALGRGNEFADLYEQAQSEAERVRARLMLKTLIFPEGMGETFRVLIQEKGVGRVELTGLKPL